MSEPYLVPMSSPDLSPAEREAVLEVVGTPNLSMGPKVQAFEQIVAERVGVRHAVAVNSGTSGLHLCVRALGIEDGDRVITTPFSFVASANVLLYERAVPVFVDVDPETGNIDTDLVAEAAAGLMKGGHAAQRWLPRRGVPEGKRLKALLPVDVFGQPADYDALNRTARQHGLPVLEDSCEALGAEYKSLPGRPSGRRRRLRLLPQQADHHRRRRADRHRSRRCGHDDAGTAQPGSRPRRYLAGAHLPRLQLPAG